MKTTHKVIVLILVVIAVAAVVALKVTQKEPRLSTTAQNENVAPEESLTPIVENESKRLPRLLELGSSQCIPCKMMEPVLEELKTHYSDYFTVDFIDIRKDRESGKKYGVRVMPTQIFFDSDGQELFRHEGFFAKEDILKTWERFGITTNSP